MPLRFDEIVCSATLSFAVALCLLTVFSARLVECSRADLATYLSMKEVPSEEEKVEKITVDTVTYASINYTYRTFDTQEYHYNEEKARYGEGRVMNVQGYLVHVTDMRDPTDHTGCSAKIMPPGRYHMGDGHPIAWIALIQRGGCTFDDKIKNAYWNHAVGVIIYNDENSMTLEKMKIIDKERNITAVFTYRWIGEEMARIVDRGTQVWVSIAEGQRILKPVTNINKTSVLFVSVSFIVLMIISLVWLIFYYVQRFRYLQSKDQHSRQLCTVAKRIIGKIPTKSGRSEDKDSENDCCAVCIEPYKPTDCIRVLPCKHEFHKNCIDPWLLEHRTCPMCKLDVLKHYGFVFIGSEESIIELDMDVESGGQNPQQVRNQLRQNNEGVGDMSIQITITPAGFEHQPNDSHISCRLPCERRSSFDAMAITRRVSIPERSSSSMSHCPGYEPIPSHTFFVQTVASSKASKNSAKGNSSKKEKESISLPGTLTASSHGSNNCYVKAATADLKHLAVRLDKGNPLIGTTCLRKDRDHEFLLANEKSPCCLSLPDQIVITIEPPENATQVEVHEKQERREDASSKEKDQ